MAEEKKKTLGSFVQNKRNRSIFFLGLSVLIILLINSTLPLIEGNSHYTVEPIEMTYVEYKALDDRYTLTYGSKLAITAYQLEYVTIHEMPVSESKLVEIPDEYPVDVNTKYFFQYTFWYVSTAISLLSAVTLFYSLFNYLIVSAKEKYKKYTDLLTEVESMRDNNLDPVTFEPWMDYIFNYRRKIEQHKANIKYKLDVLEKDTHYDIKRKFKKYYAEKDYDKRNAILIVLGKLSRKEKKYFETRNKYLDMLEQEYINEHVVHGKVKYFKYVHPMFIYNGVNIVGKTIDSYSLINSDSERISKDAGKKITMSLTITIVFATMLTVTAISSIGQSPLWIFINIIAKLAPLIIQIPMAYKYSDDFMDDHLIQNLINRRSIGLLYLADMSKNVSLKDPMIIQEEKRLAIEEAKQKQELRQGNIKVVTNSASTS